MEILKNVSVDWLSKKWLFVGTSLFLILLGVAGYVLHGGFSFGVDFTGGTIIQVKFKEAPDLDVLRESLKTEAVSAPLIQRYGRADENEIQVRMQTAFEGQDLEAGRREMTDALRQAFDPEHADTSKIDFNNVGSDALYTYLINSDPDNLKAQNKTFSEMETHYRTVAQSLLDYRNVKGAGIVNSLDDLRNASGVSQTVVDSLKNGFYAGSFAIKKLDRVGAVVGADLRRRAQWAIGLSFLGMLVYIGFRFKPVYGVVAVIALLHDVVVTAALFALTTKEVSLTVIAAFLTLIGYSINDKIVIFDRVRENLRFMRKESFYKILNLSINQTLARTIMTGSMTFLAVLVILLFGGEVLNGFAFALTVGILIGTYSSIGIASPIVEWWYRSVGQKTKRRAA